MTPPPPGHYLDDITKSVKSPSASELFGTQPTGNTSQPYVPLPSSTKNHNIISPKVVDLHIYSSRQSHPYKARNNTPISHDPCLTSSVSPLSYIGNSVDDSVGLAQTPAQSPANAQQVRTILPHDIDDVFRPLEKDEEHIHTEPVSTKKVK